LGSGLSAKIEASRVPYLPQVQVLAAQGFVTGASARNWAGYGKDVKLDASIDDTRKALLCDPQTSGGLLVACAPERTAQVMEVFATLGFPHAAVIGSLAAGTPGVDVLT
jgi:selenide,water dikinase